MARVKHTKRDFYQGQKIRRTTLTKFRLSRYIKWPKWDDTSQVHNMTLENYYHGPLADVEGVVKVRLGRTVDDVEDAVFIICEFFISQVFSLTLFLSLSLPLYSHQASDFIYIYKIFLLVN